ncbi:MAG: PEP-CTERM sorting domain-containing protein [Terracidiphilus sp.]|jgi:hypothetical protein
MMILTVGCTALQADPIDVNPTDWTTSGTTAVTLTSSANSLSFSYNDTNYYYGIDSWTFTNTATTNQTLTFNWENIGIFSWFDTSDLVTVFSGGETVDTLVNNSPSGNFEEFGSETLTVYAGETYGFTITGSNYDYSRILEGTFTISNPESPVPEPPAGWLLLTGLAALCGFSVLRQRMA